MLRIFFIMRILSHSPTLCKKFPENNILSFLCITYGGVLLLSCSRGKCCRQRLLPVSVSPGAAFSVASSLRTDGRQLLSPAPESRRDEKAKKARRKDLESGKEEVRRHLLYPFVLR